jgi:hypothetical protein
MAEAYTAYRAGRLRDFYAPLVVDEAQLSRGLDDGTLAVDTRVRDRLRVLGFGAAGGAARAGASPPEQVTPEDAAAFAGEFSALDEADLGLAYGERIGRLERAVADVQRSLPGRLGARLVGAAP